MRLVSPLRPALVLLAVFAAIFAMACADDSADSTAAPTDAADGAATAAGTTAPAEGTASPTVTATGTAAAAATDAGALTGELIVYSGRSESLIGPLIEQFEAESGLEVDVRYGGTPAVAAAILEEGDNSPADVFIAQDAGSLGRLSLEGIFAPLPQEVLDLVPAQFSSRQGDWVGLSGRVRVVIYNTDLWSEETLPDSIFDYTDPAWAGKVGWAPTNASFQSFVTAMRVTEGDDAARDWLEGMVANDVVEYPGNNEIVQAVANGEVEVGFVNHYYLQNHIEEQGEDFAARNYYFTNGDIGGLMNVAGAGVLNTAAHPDNALAFIEFMLREDSQEFFAQETTEFPLIEGVAPPVEGIPAIDTLAPADVDLTALGDLDATIAMLQEVGALP